MTNYPCTWEKKLYAFAIEQMYLWHKYLHCALAIKCLANTRERREPNGYCGWARDTVTWLGSADVLFWPLLRQKLQKEEAAWPSGQHVGHAIRRSLVRVTLWQLAGLVLGRPEFKSSATLVNNQLVASCQLGFLTLLCCVWIICF